MKKLVICNDGVDSPNKGDQAILQAMKDDFQERIPNTDTVYFPYSGMIAPRKFAEFVKGLIGADLFILGGGHPFQDLTSQAFMFFGLFLIVTARVLRKKIMCYGVGAGPIATPLSKSVIRILNLSDIISVRDPVSRDILRSLGVRDEKILLTADPAFTLKAITQDRARRILEKEGISAHVYPRVGVCLRRWFCFRHSILPEKYRRRSVSENEESIRIKKIFAKFFDYLVSKYDSEVIFLPMRKSQRQNDYGQDDDIYSAEIMEMMEEKHKSHVFAADLTPKELKGVIGQMDMLVSVRLHPIIFAVSTGIPCVGIPFAQSKGVGIFSLLEQQDKFVYIQGLDLSKLISIFDTAWKEKEKTKEHFKKILPLLESRALQNVQIVKNLIEV